MNTEPHLAQPITPEKPMATPPNTQLGIEDPKILEQRIKQEHNASVTDTLDKSQEHGVKETIPEDALPPAPQPKVTYTHEQLLEALYWIHMIFERANMTMVLVKQTGKAAYTQGKLTGDGIYIAARRLEWESGARGVIDSMAQYSEWTEDIVTYVANNGVPVYVLVCEDDYCISSPDLRLYEHEHFQLPNPFERFAEVFTDHA